jgi:hypothetical protein
MILVCLMLGYIHVYILCTHIYIYTVYPQNCIKLCRFIGTMKIHQWIWGCPELDRGAALFLVEQSHL